MAQHPLLNYEFLSITAVSADTNLTTFNTTTNSTEVVPTDWKSIAKIVSISAVSASDTSHNLMKTILVLSNISLADGPIVLIAHRYFIPFVLMYMNCTF